MVVCRLIKLRLELKQLSEFKLVCLWCSFQNSCIFFRLRVVISPIQKRDWRQSYWKLFSVFRVYLKTDGQLGFTTLLKVDYITCQFGHSEHVSRWPRHFVDLWLVWAEVGKQQNSETLKREVLQSLSVCVPACLLRPQFSPRPSDNTRHQSHNLLPPSPSLSTSFTRPEAVPVDACSCSERIVGLYFVPLSTQWRLCTAASFHVQYLCSHLRVIAQYMVI